MQFVKLQVVNSISEDDMMKTPPALEEEDEHSVKVHSVTVPLGVSLIYNPPPPEVELVALDAQLWKMHFSSVRVLLEEPV